MAAPLNIEVKQLAKGITYIKAVGVIDGSTYEKIEKELNRLFATSCFKIIVQLDQVTYMSSAGAGVFMTASGTAQDHAGNLVMLKATPDIKDVFLVLGLDQILPYADTLEEATKLLS